MLHYLARATPPLRNHSQDERGYCPSWLGVAQHGALGRHKACPLACAGEAGAAAPPLCSTFLPSSPGGGQALFLLLLPSTTLQVVCPLLWLMILAPWHLQATDPSAMQPPEQSDLRTSIFSSPEEWTKLTCANVPRSRGSRHHFCTEVEAPKHRDQASRD